MNQKSGKVKGCLIAILIVLIIIISCVLAGYFYVKSKFDKITQKPLDESDLGIETSTEADDSDTNKVDVENITKFVIFGSDSRDEDNYYAGRSDTIIIVVINNVEKKINLIKQLNIINK